MQVCFTEFCTKYNLSKYIMQHMFFWPVPYTPRKPTRRINVRIVWLSNAAEHLECRNTSLTMPGIKGVSIFLGFVLEHVFESTLLCRALLGTHQSISLACTASDNATQVWQNLGQTNKTGHWLVLPIG